MGIINYVVVVHVVTIYFHRLWFERTTEGNLKLLYLFSCTTCYNTDTSSDTDNKKNVLIFRSSR